MPAPGAEIEHHRPVVEIVFVPQHARQGRRADRAELDGPVVEALGDLPECHIFERTAAQFLFDDRRLVGFLHLPQDLAGANVAPRHPALRRAAVAVDAAQSLYRIEEPRLADGQRLERLSMCGAARWLLSNVKNPSG